MGPQSCPLQGQRQSGLGLYDILKLRKLPKKLVKTRAHHEQLTCGSIQIQPASISISKIPIQNCMDKLPRVTCLNRSGTCRTTDHLRITDMCRYPQVFASIYYYYYIKCIQVPEVVRSAVQNASKNILIGPVFIERWLKL